MKFHAHLHYGTASDTFWIEYNRRKGHFSMTVDHMHRHYELYYLLSGERQYFIKDRTYPIQPGDLVIIPSNELHKTSDTGVPNHERIVLYYDERFFEQFAPKEAELLLSPFLGPHRVIQLEPADRIRFEQLLQYVLVEMQELAPGHPLPIQHAAIEALLFAARHALQLEAKPYEAEALPPTAAKVTEIAQFITEHYVEPLTLSKLCGIFHLSSSYLSRIFKKYTGFGLTEYIGIIRTREAQQRLRHTDDRITDIASEVGFESLSQFERVFKSHVHLSPRDYRGQYGRK